LLSNVHPEMSEFSLNTHLTENIRSVLLLVDHVLLLVLKLLDISVVIYLRTTFGSTVSSLLPFLQSFGIFFDFMKDVIDKLYSALNTVLDLLSKIYSASFNLLPAICTLILGLDRDLFSVMKSLFDWV
jgi:hypothetical protein